MVAPCGSAGLGSEGGVPRSWRRRRGQVATEGMRRRQSIRTSSGQDSDVLVVYGTAMAGGSCSADMEGGIASALRYGTQRSPISIGTVLLDGSSPPASGAARVGFR